MSYEPARFQYRPDRCVNGFERLVSRLKTGHDENILIVVVTTPRVIFEEQFNWFD